MIEGIAGFILICIVVNRATKWFNEQKEQIATKTAERVSAVNAKAECDECAGGAGVAMRPSGRLLCLNCAALDARLAGAALSATDLPDGSVQGKCDYCEDRGVVTRRRADTERLGRWACDDCLSS